MRILKFRCLVFLFLFGLCIGHAQTKTFYPGEIWPDESGVHINAHGGGVLFHEGRYYWFGEARDAKVFTTLIGVNCYSSTDLYHWRKEGVALSVVEQPGHDLEKGCILERPKVIYNAKTRQFVMWFHLELKGKGYESARSGVAVSDRVTGPYRFIKSERICAGQWPENLPQEYRNEPKAEELALEWWIPEWRQAVEQGLFVRRDFPQGQMARDMTVFVDDDGKAYHIYSSEENLTLQIAELSDDYLSHTGRYIRIFPGAHNEAPTIFKRKDRYWMITSGCTGWKPNAARLAVADCIWGPWEALPNPCRGEGADRTFDSQGTYILKVEGSEDTWIFMADRWNPASLADSRYVWLPILFEYDRPVLRRTFSTL